MIVPNQENIKVHFATTEDMGHAICSLASNVNYGLGTAFPFVYRMFKNGKVDEKKIIKQVSSKYKHYILDSGLFTLMFGSLKGKKDEAYLDKWYECLTDYVLYEEYLGTMVEVDCQKVLGVEKAWEYRIKMQDKVPNRIINVFHFEDGQKGLDRLIEFSDYIALSVPELRFIKKKEYLYRLANYVKNKKPEIDIHLLGFTEKNKLDQLSFCSTCDSSSWISGVRYGEVETLVGKGHIRNIKKNILDNKSKLWLNVRNKYFPNFKIPNNLEHNSVLTFAAEQSLKIYNQYGGNQD
tara:strand:- start:1088 stop:1969 length:882 start_codon:yes stop_codon:yes gene_type:complete